jgi:hypothetical protein
MPWRRIRRSPELADPVDAFAGLGIPRRAAQAITDLLRTSVTDVVCLLLPDILDSTGVRWLWSASATFPQIAPLVARQRMPDLADHCEQAAALPALWLYPITVELTERFDAVHPDVPLDELLECGSDDDPPAPSPALRQAHDRYREAFDEPVVDRFADMGVTDESLWSSANAVAQLLRSPLNGDLPESGGWSLLAAVLALDHHRQVLPLPGRRRPRPPDQEESARSAGQAFELGRALMVATALVLIADPGTGI